MNLYEIILNSIVDYARSVGYTNIGVDNLCSKVAHLFNTGTHEQIDAFLAKSPREIVEDYSRLPLDKSGNPW